MHIGIDMNWERLIKAIIIAIILIMVCLGLVIGLILFAINFSWLALSVFVVIVFLIFVHEIYHWL